MEGIPWKRLLGLYCAGFLGMLIWLRWPSPDEWDYPLSGMRQLWEVFGGSFGIMEVVTLVLVNGAAFLGWLCWRWIGPDVAQIDDKRKRQQRIAIVVAAVLGVLVFLLVWLPSFQVTSLEKTRPKKVGAKLEDEYRKTWAAIFGGGILLAGVFVAFRRSEAAMRLAEATELGNTTERFTRAIEQLGAVTTGEKQNVAVRLGGIYALERLANEAPETLRFPIMRVLAGYLRHACPKSPPPGWTTPPEDIKAILQALRECCPTGNGVENGFEFSNLHLPDTNFFGIELSETDFSNSTLSFAGFVMAGLQHVDFESADLKSALFTGADLKDADLKDADLKGADLKGAINLTEAQISGAVYDKETKLPDELAHLKKT